MDKKLYVGNLSWNTNEDSLREAFSPYGQVIEVNVVTDRETGRSRGFAFVTMNTSEEASAAIEGLGGAMLDGRPLRVNVAEDRKRDRQPRAAARW